jgi:hypothetical protein
MQVYNAIVLRNLPQCRGEDVDYSFYRGDKVILTIEDDGVMWIDEIGHNPATSIEVDEDDVAYFKTDNLFELLERRVNNDLQHDLDNVDMYLGDLASVIKVQQNRVKLTRDKLNQITDDEITTIKSTLDSAFNLTWEYDVATTVVTFTTKVKELNLDVYYYYTDKFKGTYCINAAINIDGIEYTDEFIIDRESLQSIDEVISYISTFFLRLRESVNYLEVNNADSTIHTIAD